VNACRHLSMRQQPIDSLRQRLPAVDSVVEPSLSPYTIATIDDSGSEWVVAQGLAAHGPDLVSAPVPGFSDRTRSSLHYPDDLQRSGMNRRVTRLRGSR
jgi:hypothetical protein